MGDENPGEFERIVDADAQRDKVLLAPIRRDSRIGVAILRVVSPELPGVGTNGVGTNKDLDTLFKKVAADLKVDVALVREAFETGKNILQREKEHGD